MDNQTSLQPDNNVESTQVTPQPTAIAPPIEPDATRDVKRQMFHYFLYILIGGVVISALISIAAVLIGSWNDQISKALLTTLSMVFHAFVALALTSAIQTKRSLGQNIALNVAFAVTVASFFTSVLSTWNIISGGIVYDLYQLYLCAILASLIVLKVLQLSLEDTMTRNLAYTSIGLTIFMFVYVQPAIFIDDLLSSILPDIYYRGIAALGILLFTSLVITAIFDKLYIAKHPRQ